MIQALAMIELRTAHWEETLHFYREGLGLDGSVREERGWAEFKFPGGGATLALRREANPGGAPQVDIDLQVASLSEALATLKARQIEPVGSILEGKGYRMAQLRDPEGNTVQLFERAG